MSGFIELVTSASLLMASNLLATSDGLQPSSFLLLLGLQRSNNP